MATSEDRIGYAIDSNALRKAGTLPICFISIMHIVQATLLLYWPASAMATDIIALIKWVVFDGDHRILAAIMLASSFLSFVGALVRVGRARIAFFVPQHMLLGVMAYGGLAAVIQRSYLDGTVIPWPHILSDQIGYCALFAIHFSAIIRRSRAQDG